MVKQSLWINHKSLSRNYIFVFLEDFMFLVLGLLEFFCNLFLSQAHFLWKEPQQHSLQNIFPKRIFYDMLAFLLLL